MLSAQVLASVWTAYFVRFPFAWMDSPPDSLLSFRPFDLGLLAHLAHLWLPLVLEIETLADLGVAFDKVKETLSARLMERGRHLQNIGCA